MGTNGRGMGTELLQPLIVHLYECMLVEACLLPNL